MRHWVQTIDEMEPAKVEDFLSFYAPRDDTPDTSASKSLIPDALEKRVASVMLDYLSEFIDIRANGYDLPLAAHAAAMKIVSLVRHGDA